MSGKIIPAGHRQYIVVVRGYGFVTRSNLLTRKGAIRLLTRLTFKEVAHAAGCN